MTVVMYWSHRVEEVSDRGLDAERAFSGADCRALADWLDVPDCNAFSATYRITRVGSRRYRMAGKVRAALVLTCSVTLDPMVQTINEPFDVEFWPADEIGPRAIAFEALAADDPEPIVNNRIEAGRLIGEILASAIDPFPRLDDAQLETIEAGRGEDEPSPFAALASLKPRPDTQDPEGG